MVAKDNVRWMASAKPVEPTTMCVNMTYDPGPLTQAEMDAARPLSEFDRVRKILREHGESID